MDPRVLANFLEALWCLGLVGTEQLSPEGMGGPGTGHLVGLGEKGEVGRGPGHLGVAFPTSPERWPIQLPQHRNKGSAVPLDWLPPR